ncbi:siderophore-interacting protein [Nocardia sp. BMG51109]|uniref:siderophore-interacting protein n=1 Tax=Nocardia sp. BMG51109 TaxID=1056816 RepID=UPI0004648D74|nr:siderophore-interacting protein [Nocardia sp. BMG51109]
MGASIKAGIRERAQGNQLLSLELSVARVEKLSPGFSRVVLTGPALDEYRDPRPADAFKLMLPPKPGAAVDGPVRGESGLPEWNGGEQPVLRAFTVRRFDSAARELTLDVARHEQGVSIDWLAAVRPGDTVALSGMRPEWAVADGVHDHILIGDGTALPAIAAIIESLDPADTVTAYLTVPDPADIALVPAHPNLALHRVDDIAEAAGHTPAPIAAGRRAQVWIAAEAGKVRRVRTDAVHHWGIDRADLLARAYWKLGSTSTDNDSATLVKYQEAIAGGQDIHDPALAETIELGA